MSDLIQLLDIEAWDGAAVKTLRLSTHDYVTARSDADPDQPYLTRIVGSVALTRNAWGTDTTRSESTLALGSVTVANADGALDDWIHYAYAGRPVTLRLVRAGAPLASAVTLFCGVMEQPQFDWAYGGGNSGAKGLVFLIRDRSFPLSTIPIQTNRYGGTNSLPSGVDGVDDLKGQYKPRLFGHAQRIQPPSVNTAKLIYQVNDGPLADVPAVYDKGMALARGADYASLAEVLSLDPPASTYRVYPAGGLFRLGSTPAGTVLCDATEGATAAQRYPGAVAARVLQAAGVVSDDIDMASLAAIDAACPWECGYWAGTAEVLPAAILDALMTSVGGWWSATAEATFRAGVLSAPAGDAVFTLDPYNLISVTRRQAKDVDRGIPPWQVDVGYARYWSVGTETASTAPQALRDDMASEHRRVVASDSAILTAYPAASSLLIDTLLRHKADAQAFAAERLAVLGVQRSILQAVARLDAIPLRADVGDVVRVQIPRYGHGDGVLYRVLGSTLDRRIDRDVLSLWG